MFPNGFTFEFLKTLGFRSSNDRPIITVLKGIGFLDQNGSPTDTYRAYRDPHQGPKVLRQAIKRAYSDLFIANTKAHELTVEKLKGIIASKTSKTDQVVRLGVTGLLWLPIRDLLGSVSQFEIDAEMK